MGVFDRSGCSCRFPIASLLLIAVCATSGCSITSPKTTGRLLRHREWVDYSGLKPIAPIPSVKVSAAMPDGWISSEPKTMPLYTHQQCRSGSGMTAVGVAFVHMPLPLSASTLAWFAKNEYSKRSGDGRVIGQWVDSLGRTWFEVENRKYHVRGYVVTHGREAWIIYMGYRRAATPDPLEMALALRSLETIVPMPGETTEITREISP